jgi:hypothetical protein
MVRTQLQIDEATYESLRNTAHKQKKSMSAVVREILRESLIGPRKQDEQIQETDLKTKFSWIGLGKSCETDISVRHDDYLAGDFQ